MENRRLRILSERFFVPPLATNQVRSTSSCVSGGTLGAFRKNFINPSPFAFPARFLKNSAAVSITPIGWRSPSAAPASAGRLGVTSAKSGQGKSGLEIRKLKMEIGKRE